MEKKFVKLIDLNSLNKVSNEDKKSSLHKEI